MSISVLLEYSLPVCGIELCAVWIIVHYVLEPYAMPKVFGATYTNMDIVARRSLTNHVVSFFLKAICCCGIYSVWQVLVAQRPFDLEIEISDRIHATLTVGDFLAFCYLTVPTIYIFELIYRANISIVSAVHHVGAISINVMGLIIIIGHQQRGFLASTEFKLILVYGTFEMIFEIFPHMAVILYRLMRDRPSFLYKIFLSAACGIFVGTLLEQVAIAFFYHQVWRGLPVSYKVTGLFLHVCFMVAQLHGGRVCLQIARKMAEEAKGKDPEQQEFAADDAMTPVAEMRRDADLESGLMREHLQAAAK